MDEAALVLEEAARLHAPRWGDPALDDYDWLVRYSPEGRDAMQGFLMVLWPNFVERYGDRLEEGVEDLGHRFIAGLGAWYALRPEPHTVVHNDYRLDNLLFGVAEGGPPVAVVDWQTVGIGLPGRDLAYFTATSLDPDVRSEIEKDLVAQYHQALLGYGITDYDFDTCWRDYRLGVVQAPLLTGLGFAFAASTERGDEMMLTMLHRGCRAIRELETLELIKSYQAT